MLLSRTGVIMGIIRSMKRCPLILLLLVLILTACQQNDSPSGLPAEVATLTHPAVSPSGKYRLVLLDSEKDGNKMLSFQVQDASGKSLYQAADLFSTRNKTYFLWDAQERVWVSAGPQGTFFWQKEGESWTRSDSITDSTSLPPFLKQAAPLQH
jgi:hypothetical protein